MAALRTNSLRELLRPMSVDEPIKGRHFDMTILDDPAPPKDLILSANPIVFDEKPRHVTVPYSMGYKVTNKLLEDSIYSVYQELIAESHLNKGDIVTINHDGMLEKCTAHDNPIGVVIDRDFMRDSYIIQRFK